MRQSDERQSDERVRPWRGISRAIAALYPGIWVLTLLLGQPDLAQAQAWSGTLTSLNAGITNKELSPVWRAQLSILVCDEAGAGTRMISNEEATTSTTS